MTHVVTFPEMTADALGAATTVSSMPIEGKIGAIYVKTPTTPKGGSTVLVETTGAMCPADTLLSLSSSKTSGWFHPHHTAQDYQGADLTYDATHKVADPMHVADNVQIVIAGANASDVYQVWMIIEDR